MSEITTLPADLDFPDVKIVGKEAIRLPTYANAIVALNAMGVECSYDVFRDRRYVGGELLTSQVGQVTDDVCLLIRALCRTNFGFDPGKDHTWDAVNFNCRLNSFHPIKNYLADCENFWDGKRRIDTWMTDYLGVPDSPLTRALSRLVLIASVRRVRQPGCKYDHMIVLVGPENKAKSLAIATLYGQENFTDQKIIGVSDKELAEQLRGMWGVESAELAGLRKADIDHLKAQISRQYDRVRHAFMRARTEVGRECVLWGTTNDPIFLRLAHGNRRLVPQHPGKIDIAALARDRDQLWAEASIAEAKHGPALTLPDSVWEEAQAARERHTESDPWSDRLGDVAERAERAAFSIRARNEKRTSDEWELIPYDALEFGSPPVERIASWWLLSDALDIAAERQSPALTHRLSTVMQSLGWSEPHQMKIGGRNQRGYERPFAD